MLCAFFAGFHQAARRILIRTQGSSVSQQFPQRVVPENVILRLRQLRDADWRGCQGHANLSISVKFREAVHAPVPSLCRPACLDTSLRALDLAAPEGSVRVFVDAGPDMDALLIDAVKHGATGDVAPDYLAALMAAFGRDDGTTDEDHPSGLPRTGAQPLIEPLSDRELEVLDLIAAGLSNQEISDRLFLALSTVKGHNRNIFGKLQVQRRTEAVARARELGLL